MPSNIILRPSSGYRELIHTSTTFLTTSTEPKSYNNRAAAYTKLLAMPEALKDAEEAIKIDPKFIKAYIRKALTQQAMKEHSKALETLQKATEIDVEKKVSLGY